MNALGPRPKICFVAPDAYPVLSGGSDDLHFGGAAIQQVLIARELAPRGLGVSFVTWDYGQPDGIEHDGISVWKMCGRNAGLPGLRFLYPRWTSLWAALRRADADVYYQRGAGSETGQVAMWCRLRERVFIFAAASDTNCQVDSPEVPTRRERALYTLGLRLANRIIAQSDQQVRAIRQQFGRDAVLVRSCAGDPGGLRAGRVPGDPPRLLWVGRLAPKKRFELLLDLAESSPEWQFEVVGDSAADGAYARRLIARAQRLPNLTLHGRVPHGEIGARYDAADLLLCTSPAEGFPNTFLEAWARGVPTISTVDPDGLIVAHGLGACGQTVRELQSAIRRLLDTPQTWRAYAQRAREHFAGHHSICAAGDAYEGVIQQLLQGAELAGGVAA